MLEVKNRDGEPYLIYEVLHGDFMLYDIPIIKITAEEDNILARAGRFTNMWYTADENEVSFEHQSTFWAMKGLETDYRQKMTAYIEWIAAETKGNDEAWYFALDVRSVSHIITKFYFTNPDTALQFKLSCL